MSTILTCPQCGSGQVTVAHIQAFMANTDEHYCHSVKTHDDESPSMCLDCDWEGMRKNLVQAHAS